MPESTRSYYSGACNTSDAVTPTGYDGEERRGRSRSIAPLPLYLVGQEQQNGVNGPYWDNHTQESGGETAPTTTTTVTAPKKKKKKKKKKAKKEGEGTGGEEDGYAGSEGQTKTKTKTKKKKQ